MSTIIFIKKEEEIFGQFCVMILASYHVFVEIWNWEDRKWDVLEIIDESLIIKLVVI